MIEFGHFGIVEFIVLGSKRQRDVLKKWFPIDILGSPLHPADSLGMSIQFAKVPLFICEILEG